MRTTRGFFEAEGFTEVQTPLLSRDIVVDAHIEPFVVQSPHGTLYLQTSPEFAMKRLLAAGARSIFQICHAFRQGEAGDLHNPEFTMLEWYQADSDYCSQMNLTERLLRTVAADRLELPPDPFPRISYDDAFERAVGRPVLSLSPEDLCRLAADLQVDLPATTDRSDRDELLNLLLADRVEPTLGSTGPEFLFDYPSTQAALSEVRADTPPVAERFELYYRGMELCNGYQELTDAQELRRRNSQQNGIRQKLGKSQLPEDSHLLAAMDAGLPACSGVALGMDRLLMLLLGLTRIEDVWAFPINRA